MLSEFLEIGDFEIAYDNVRLADYFIVRGVDMPMLPTITANSVTVDGKPGAWFTSRQIGTRDVTVRLGLLSETKKNIDALETWINNAYLVGKDTPHRLDLGKGYYVNAIMNGTSDISKNGRWSTVSISFKCFDPCIYGETHTLELKQGSNKYVILGKAPVSPIFTIKSTSASYCDVEDNTTKKMVRVLSPGTANQLVLDMEKHRCTLGGVYKAVDPTMSDFFTLTPGEQTINTKYCYGTMEYTEVYL